MAPKSRGSNSKLSRRTAIALIAGGGLAAIGGTNAFTQTNADRKFNVGTATDENALIGIKTVDVVFTQTGQKKTILKLNNQTNSEILLNNRSGIVIDSAHSFLHNIDYPDSIETDDGWVDVKAQMGKKRENQRPIELKINAESDSTSISIVHTLELSTDISLPKSCPVSPVSVDSSAQGTVENPESLSEDVDGDVRISTGNDLDLTGNTTIRISGSITGSSTGNVKLQNDKVGGHIETSSGKKVNLKKDSVVTEYVHSGSGAYISKSMIGGEIKTGSGNDITIKKSTVCGLIKSDGNAHIKNGSEIKGIETTTAGKNITVYNNATVTQGITLEGGGTITIKGGAVVNGDITANDGKVEGSGTVNGNITADEISDDLDYEEEEEEEESD